MFKWNISRSNYQLQNYTQLMNWSYSSILRVTPDGHGEGRKENQHRRKIDMVFWQQDLQEKTDDDYSGRDRKYHCCYTGRGC
ncbi:MAG: hypothetical protein ABSH06_11695 [Thermodesulfobacteriota bacterium]